MEYSAAHRLAEAIRQSEEYQTYHRLKETVNQDATTAALIAEYRKLSVALQLGAMSGTAPAAEDMQRFQGISSLLFAKPETQQFLLSEMRMQQLLADVFKIITDAAGVDFNLPQPS